MLTCLPLAVDIASEALVRWGIEPDAEGVAFGEVMAALSKLAPADEFLAYDVYVLKQKFLPAPPPSALKAAAAKAQRRPAAKRDDASVDTQSTPGGK